MKPHYRIVRDRYMGYEVQIWRWWWPFWMEAGVNTFSTEEKAESWARAYSQRVVKYLGTLKDE